MNTNFQKEEDICCQWFYISGKKKYDFKLKNTVVARSS